MTTKKEKTCKYPKCHKIVPTSKDVFCSEHKKQMKSVGKTAFGGLALVLSSLLILPKDND